MKYTEEEMKSLMIDHIEGKLDGELKEYVEKHISKNPDSKKEYDQLKQTLYLFDHVEDLEPSIAVKDNFLQHIEETKLKTAEVSEAQPKMIQLKVSWLYRAAAAIAILMVGVLIGRTFAPGNEQEMASLKQEMEETRALVLASLQNQTSASSRIQGVLASYEVDADDVLLDALIERMNEDENVNVRIAAVEALGNYADNPKVTSALIDALSNQDKPLVQIRLIHLMVELDEKSAIKSLESLSEDDNVMNTVQDEAQMGVFKLM